MRVVITGGSGSLGQALTRHFLAAGAERIVVFSRGEFAQAEMARSLVADAAFGKMVDHAVRFFIGDVRDRDRMIQAFYGCDVVVHAAALKRLDGVSSHVGEIMKTNVVGTHNTIEAAMEAGVRKVVLISSDKAVEALGAYGSSKAFAEQIAVCANTYSYPRGTSVSALRYGNVLGSRGSVVHLWREQVAAGRPIQLTHWDMTRFLLTLPQACQLVAAVLGVMDGGEIFVPYLPALGLRTLAWAIGGPDYPVEIVGLRPGGEKLHERLLSHEEVGRAEVVPTGLMIPPHFMSWGSKIRRGAPYTGPNYTSETAPRLSVDEMRELLKDAP